MWLIRNFVVILYSFLIAIVSLIVFPVDNKKKTVSSSVMRAWTRGSLFIFGVRVKVIGKENVARGTGKVYISNHASYLDIFTQLAYLPDNVRMVYKKEINKVPLLGWAMMATGFISIDRENIRSAMSSLEKAAEKIRNGLSIVIYPEGTRTRDGSVGEFKRGMFFLADKAKSDIIPVSIVNSFDLMPGGSGRVKPGTITMVIGKSMGYKKDKAFLNEIRDVVIKNMQI
jgi:1-acyl-sn-glycerol-3-phosphate acyltransferase